MAARRRFISQADAEALVRYSPEISGLTALMKDAGTTYHRALHQAAAGRSAIQASTATALEQLKSIYPQAAGGIPGLSREQALGDVVSRGISAGESEAASRRTALGEYTLDKGKISDRQQALLREIGAFKQGRVASLGEEAATRATSVKTARIRAGATVKAAQIRADATGKGKPKSASATAAKAFQQKYGVKLATQVQHNAKRSEVDAAMAVIRDQIAAGNKDRRQLGQLLTLGRPAKTVTLGGKKVPLPSIPKVDPFVASLALDLAFSKHVSDGNAREAHRRGYSVSRLGLPGATAAERRKARSAQQVAALGQSLQRAVGL